MTREEKKIWQATYGAAYVSIAMLRHVGGEDYEVGLLAAELANGAVRALRARRKTGAAADVGKIVTE